MPPKFPGECLTANCHFDADSNGFCWWCNALADARAHEAAIEIYTFCSIPGCFEFRTAGSTRCAKHANADLVTVTCHESDQGRMNECGYVLTDSWMVPETGDIIQVWTLKPGKGA